MDWRDGHNAGVIHQDVDAAEALDGSFDERLHFDALRDVDGEPDSLTAGGRNLVDDCVYTVLTPRSQDNLCSLCCEKLGGAFPDAAAGSGDYYDPSLEYLTFPLFWFSLLTIRMFPTLVCAPLTARRFGKLPSPTSCSRLMRRYTQKDWRFARPTEAADPFCPPPPLRSRDFLQLFVAVDTAKSRFPFGSTPPLSGCGFPVRVFP
jgi:hypothetical protein